VTIDFVHLCLVTVLYFSVDICCDEDTQVDNNRQSLLFLYTTGWFNTTCLHLI
jgi:hypothetical protein